MNNTAKDMHQPLPKHFGSHQHLHPMWLSKAWPKHSPRKLVKRRNGNGTKKTEKGIPSQLKEKRTY